MVHGRLRARHRLLAARPHLVDKVLLEADRFLGAGSPPDCCIIGFHGILAAHLPPLGPITPVKSFSLPGFLIASPRFMFGSTPVRSGVRKQHGKPGHADNRDLPPQFQKRKRSSAALLNRHHLA